MRPSDAAIFFSERLNAERSLRDDEVDILADLIGARLSRSWSREDDDLLRRIATENPRHFAPIVAEMLDRSRDAVHMRWRRLSGRL